MLKPKAIKIQNLQGFKNLAGIFCNEIKENYLTRTQVCVRPNAWIPT